LHLGLRFPAPFLAPLRQAALKAALLTGRHLGCILLFRCLSGGQLTTAPPMSVADTMDDDGAGVSIKLFTVCVVMVVTPLLGYTHIKRAAARAA
jgi:hypothetical protein